MNMSVQFWLYLALAMIMLELSFSGLVFFFFGLGSAAAALVCLLPLNEAFVWAAPAVYALASAFSFVYLREPFKYALSGSLFDAHGTSWFIPQDSLLGTSHSFIKGSHISSTVVGNISARSAVNNMVSY